jgi:predicted ATP-grasp superfamily ATP-dependent carboligase
MTVIGRAAQLKVRGGLHCHGCCRIITGAMVMAKDKILVVELTTAGGIGTGKGRLEAISIEGLAMVHALVTDAVNGGFETHAVLQGAIEVPPRLASMADVHWHRIGAGTRLQGTIRELAPLMDFCFVVAPEFGNYLEEYTGLLESYNCVVLSQPSVGTSAASDKKGALARLSAAGVDVPATQALEDFITAPVLAYPVVVKPNRGAGSIGVFLARDEAELNDAIAANETLSFPRGGLIVQAFIAGTPLSASAIASPRGAALLGINEQDVSLAPARVSESKYRGGISGPLHPGIAAACGRMARVAAKLFQLDGYFGFDFILDPGGAPIVVEINPRLTTSFAGLKMLQPESLLRFMADRKGGKKASLPWIPRDDFVAYRIVALPGSTASTVRRMDQSTDQQVISLGIPGDGFTAFVATTGPTRAEAIERLGHLVTELQRNED